MGYTRLRNTILTRISDVFGPTGTSIVYKFLAALNASNAQPLTAKTGTAPTQVATSAVTAPFYLTTIAAGTTLQTIPAGYPVVPYSRVTWDTALGAVAGSELITVAADREFTSDTGFWSKAGTNVTITDGVLRLTASGSESGILKALITAGKTYKVQFTIINYVSGAFRFQDGATTTPPRSANGTYTETIKVGTTSARFNCFGSSTLDVDNISVKEITPAYLPTDSAAAALATPTVLSSGLTRYASGPAGNPTLAVLCEPSGTNLALHSNTFSNAAWAKSNITPTQNAVGPDGVTNSAWTLVAGADNGTMLQSVTSASATRNMAIYLKRKTGTGAISLTVDNGVTYTPKTLDGNWQRFDITQAAVTNPVFGLKMATSGDEIYAYQVDLCSNSVANTPITTTTGTVTRNARYETILGTELTNRFNAQICSNEVLQAGARDMRIFSDGTRMAGYNRQGMLYFMDQSQLMGSALTSGTALVVGKTYKIISRSTFDFTTVGAANNNANTIFTLSGACTLGAGDSVQEVAELTYSMTGATALAAGTPAVIGVDASSTAWKMYVDGVEKATATAPAAATWGTTVYVGSSTTGTNVFNGGIAVIQGSSDAGFNPGATT